MALKRGTFQAQSFQQPYLEAITQENRRLKEKLEQLERENLLLKNSIFTLSTKLNDDKRGASERPVPFSVESLLAAAQGDFSRSNSTKREEEDLSSIPSSSSSSSSLSSQSDSSRTNTLHPPKPMNLQLSQLRTLTGHKGAVYTAKFSNCGNWIASASLDQTIRVSSLQKRFEISLQDHTLAVSDVGWNPVAGLLEIVSGSFDKTVRVWDLQTATSEVPSSSAPPPPSPSSSSTTNQTPSSSDQQAAVMTTPVFTSSAAAGFIQCVAYLPSDQHVIVAGSSHHELLLFDKRASKRPVLKILNDSKINSLETVKDGKVVTGDANGNVKVWDLRSETVSASTSAISVVNVTNSPISSLSLSPSSDPSVPIIAVNSYDSVVRLYDAQKVIEGVRDLAPLYSLSGPKNSGLPIRNSFMATGTKRTVLLSGSGDGSGYVFDPLLPSPLIHRLQNLGERVYGLSSSSSMIAASSSDGNVYLWSHSFSSSSLLSSSPFV